MLDLIEKCEIKAGLSITLDNMFNSPPLLDEMNELEIGELGTIRQNHFLPHQLCYL